MKNVSQQSYENFNPRSRTGNDSKNYQDRFFLHFIIGTDTGKFTKADNKNDRPSFGVR